MPQRDADVRALADRMDRLESRMRRWRAVAVALGLCLFAGVLAGQDRNGAVALRSLRVRELTLEDERGLARIQLDTERDVARIRVLDGAGRKRILIGSTGEGEACDAVAQWFDAAGHMRLEMGTFHDRAAPIRAYDALDQMRIAIGTDAHNRAAMKFFGYTPQGQRIVVDTVPKAVP